MVDDLATAISWVCSTINMYQVFDMSLPSFPLIAGRAVTRSIYPRAGDAVYESCDQDSPLVWGELPQDWMPDDQLITVWVFR